MTDREKLIALCADFGLAPAVDWAAAPAECYRPPDVEYPHRVERVTFTVGDAKVEGYSCFAAAFEFDADGRFLALQVFE